MLPPKTHPRWRELVLGKVPARFSLLATQFFVTRVTGRARIDPSAENIARLIDDAYSFFLRNEKLAQNDIRAIFGRETR
jgi:hypothetical protein